MGLLDAVGRMFGGGGGPSRNIVDLDPETKGLIDKSVEGVLSRDTQSFKDEAMSGVPEAFAATQETPSQQVQSNMGMSPFMGDAIRSKYQQENQSELERFKTQSDLRAAGERSHQLNRNFNFAMAAQNVQIQNMQKLAEANMQSTMMRAQVIGDILGAGGKAAGMYMANRKPQSSQADYTGGWNIQQPRSPIDMMNNQMEMVG